MPSIQRAVVHEASDRLRAVGRGVPRWHCAEIDGRAVLIADGTNERIAEFSGPWSQGLLRFFTAVNGSTVTAFAELLWEIQRGATPNVTRSAETLIKQMRFEARTLDATHWLVDGEVEPESWQPNE